ncbi:hypothetical protein COCCADRAFT_104332 [Bipolaris zeicola 26-R-13]|uniref:Uncharacterized protein n=1 Tax=Cochliobolus carbonum (strain 26-R-13) TaxID=930089 RepID=W6XWZ5_COCC2|nr:uncharacterized protein COCCADRAFT_104332 [Bipolaris zeicola 26-R-13]EUC30283.1 hypothetical protein COCCADRAFT_104332 [Bipolaris zeicola 26-R-13]
MASTQAHHDWTAPHFTTTDATTPPHIHPAPGDCPHSPDALAAAVTLATLSDNSPPTSHADHADDNHNDDADDDDDGYGGGISLADYQQFMEDMPPPQGALGPDEEQGQDDAAVEMHMQTFLSQVHPAYVAYHPFEIFDVSSTPHNTSTTHIPAPPIYMSHVSSGDPALEPPPTLNEPHLSIQDKGAFCPITSYFHHYFNPDKAIVPGLDLIHVPNTVARDDLKCDHYDYQGIDWEVRKTTRSAVRESRFEFESEKLSPGLKQVRKSIAPTPNTDVFFNFARINTTPRVFVPHFQLRNVLTATSHNDIYYAYGHRVYRTDAQGAPADVVVDLSKRIAIDGSVTTIASRDNVLIAGAFEGEYAITDLSSTYGSSCTFGRTTDFVTDTKSRIVNHMHLFDSRWTYSPQAVLCSNDHHLRILDCATNTFTNTFVYSAAVNCSATSPNGRLRVVVGDFQETLITNAETGEAFETLNTHADDAFACAWADDGIHVATAAQDSTIVVWDARYWREPLAVMKSELAVPRSLHFSPLGSGPRVLVAAEADDYINIINAQTWESKQVFDFFGPVGGAAFTPDGQSLFIANGEKRFGGIIELERAGWPDASARRNSLDHEIWDDIATDWAHDDVLSQACGKVHGGDVARRRRNVDLSNVVV